jgi:hypothetical protein
MGASWLLFLNFYCSLGCIEFYLLLYFFVANGVLAWCTLFVFSCGLMLLLLFGCHCWLLLFVCFLLWFDVAAGVTFFATYYCLFASCCGLMLMLVFICLLLAPGCLLMLVVFEANCCHST